jgi:hypothetical protein
MRKLLSCGLVLLTLGLHPGQRVEFREIRNLLWPLGNGCRPHELRATYLQPEGAGVPKLHLGLDIIAKKGGRKVYALEDGIVVLRVDDAAYVSGLLVASEAVPGRGFLYLHMDGSSIQFARGQKVEADDWLGDVVSRDDVTGVTHLHLARIEGKKKSYPWATLSELSVKNPLKMIDPDLLGDDEDPVIAASITAGSITGSPLMFRGNEDPSSTASTYSSTTVAGEWNDVIARVHDTDGRSSNRLAPYELALSLAGAGGTEIFHVRLDGPPPRDPWYPELIDAKAIYNHDGILPTTGVDLGVASTALANYFVLTNGAASPSSPAAQSHAWMPAPGTYDLELEVKDVAGNTEQATMTVTVE